MRSPPLWMYFGVPNNRRGGLASTKTRCNFPAPFQQPNNSKMKSAGDGQRSPLFPWYIRATSFAYSFRDMLSLCETAFDEWNLIDLCHVPRAMSTERLAEFFEPMGAVTNKGPLPDLWQSLMSRVSTGDRIVVFGSFFSVGEATAHLAAHQQDGEQN